MCDLKVQILTFKNVLVVHNEQDFYYLLYNNTWLDHIRVQLILKQ